MWIDVIKAIERDYPLMMRPKHLIELGFFSSRECINFAIRTGTAPPSLLMGKRLRFFPRPELCKWIIEKMEQAYVLENTKKTT